MLFDFASVSSAYCLLPTVHPHLIWIKMCGNLTHMIDTLAFKQTFQPFFLTQVQTSIHSMTFRNLSDNILSLCTLPIIHHLAVYNWWARVS